MVHAGRAAAAMHVRMHARGHTHCLAPVAALNTPQPRKGKGKSTPVDRRGEPDIRFLGRVARVGFPSSGVFKVSPVCPRLSQDGAHKTRHIS